MPRFIKFGRNFYQVSFPGLIRNNPLCNYYERAKQEKFFSECRSFWQFDPTRPTGSCEPYISTTMPSIILKQKRKDAYFSKLRFIKFSKQSTKPSEYEIYSNTADF